MKQFGKSRFYGASELNSKTPDDPDGLCRLIGSLQILSSLRRLNLKEEFEWAMSVTYAIS